MEYNAVQLGDAADPNLVISVGDWVYITPAKKGEWMEIGLITALWQDDVTGKGYDAKWTEPTRNSSNIRNKKTGSPRRIEDLPTCSYAQGIICTVDDTH